MNGAHDLGGMHGLGPINPEPERAEPIFHEEWEKRALGLTLTAGWLGQWNIDISRFARERQHPVAYLSNSYYENWLTGLETLLVERGVISPEELTQGKAINLTPAELIEKCAPASAVQGILSSGGPCDMATDDLQKFQIGDKIKVVQFNPTGHTRAPRYIRGHEGMITNYYGSFIFPDENAQDNKIGQHLYNVSFDGNQLWGKDNDTTIHVDLWQSYMEPA
ncbi:nitrile hydratase subunit beta [Kiloniella majae]|uniref:nitrile hydratase subunit beta n=1 Tax=Kiloniella majae TaxID=1938558 RepID=UPI000A277A54|nr:nitrile hydratase subunit beta [Kiloniella majae]